MADKIRIDQLVRSHRRTIALMITPEASPKPSIPSFVDGEKFPYLGELYSFQAYDGSRIRIEGGLLFPRDLLPQARQEMEFWYKQEAAKVIPERVEHHMKIMGVRHSGVRMSSARTRWGSCGPSGDVQFSWKLVMAPLPVIDYVVVHELAHLTVRDHSKRFWALVAEFYPAYRQCRRWLKDNQRMLDLTEKHGSVPY